MVASRARPVVWIAAVLFAVTFALLGIARIALLWVALAGTGAVLVAVGSWRWCEAGMHVALWIGMTVAPLDAGLSIVRRLRKVASGRYYPRHLIRCSRALPGATVVRCECKNCARPLMDRTRRPGIPTSAAPAVRVPASSGPDRLLWPPNFKKQRPPFPHTPIARTEFETGASIPANG